MGTGKIHRHRRGSIFIYITGPDRVRVFLSSRPRTYQHKHTNGSLSVIMSVPPTALAPEPSLPQRDDQKKNDGTPSSEESEVSDVAEVTEDDNQNLTPGLPFSKARCIALVVVLAGASFLNVRRQSLLFSLPPASLTESTPKPHHN